jgi:BirA family transcriptional regulator, biotin operon repressor / biotin---[acetyl-CoA-carboxylase] ligase
MKEQDLHAALAGLPIPFIRYFSKIGSTNSEALSWVEGGASEYSLVFADCQTAGRGRMNRRWITRPGSALAFSLILHPVQEEIPVLSLFSPLCGMAVASALVDGYGIADVQVKWPNDVLINRKKVCGILVESAWMGDRLQGVAAGIGVNVKPEAVPPPGQVLYPAVCVEQALGRPVDRPELLSKIVAALIRWRPRVGREDFIAAWNDRLAYRGEWVRVEQEGHSPIEGLVSGIEPGGHLQLKTQDGKLVNVAFGDVHLRPAMT